MGLALASLARFESVVALAAVCDGDVCRVGVQVWTCGCLGLGIALSARRAATTSSWLSFCAWARVCGACACDCLSGYAEDIWTRRGDIYAACARSEDLYATLKEHASVYGLAATQVPPCRASSTRDACFSTSGQVLRYLELLGCDAVRAYRSAEDRYCGERCRMCACCRRVASVPAHT